MMNMNEFVDDGIRMRKRKIKYITKMMMILYSSVSSSRKMIGHPGVLHSRIRRRRREKKKKIFFILQQQSFS